MICVGKIQPDDEDSRETDSRDGKMHSKKRTHYFEVSNN